MAPDIASHPAGDAPNGPRDRHLVLIADLAADASASYELRLAGERFHVEVMDGELELGRGAAEDPALTIEGGRREASRFFRLFPVPEPCSAGRGQDAEEESGVEVTV